LIQPLYSALFNKSAESSRPSSSLASQIFKAAFYCLASLFVLGTLFALIPLQLTKIDWYLRQAATLASSFPLIIAALCFGIGAVLHSDTKSNSSRTLRIIARIGRFGTLFLIISLPILLALTLRFTNQNLVASRAQEFQLNSQFNELKSRANQARTLPEFISLLQANGITIQAQPSETLNLVDAKTESFKILDSQFNKQKDELSAQRRRRLYSDIAEGVKLLVSWIIAIIFFSNLQRFSASLIKRA
jgi:hypothetical protein